MALRAHPTIPSDLTPEQAFDSNTGFLRASSSGNPTLSVRYWITTRLILQIFSRNRLEDGYDILYYTPFSSEAAWTHVHPDQAITNTISVQTNKTNTQTVTSQASLMSTSLAPITSTAHGSPPNIVDPTVQLIALMQQLLQQNATMLAQINSRSSPHQPQTKWLAYQFKLQRPPFPKWDGTLPTTPLLLAQIETYKAKAFYASIQYWTKTTQTTRQISVAIISDILASLQASISSMFLKNARFASDGITILSSLITHRNPSSNENLLLEITDLTRLEIRLGESSIDYMSRVRGISQRMHGVTIDRIIPLFAISSLDNNIYPGVKSRYLAGDTVLVNCNLLQLIGLLSSEETRQQALGITAVPQSTPSVDRVYHNNSQNERPVPAQHQPTTPLSNVPYPPSRGVPWN